MGGGGYAALRALRLRQALVDPEYRTRALWTAIGASSVFFFLLALYSNEVFGQVATTLEGLAVEVLAWGAALFVLVGWLRANVNIAILADFFNRDPLRWRRGGWYFTVAMFVAGYVLSGTPSWLLPANGVNLGLVNAMVAVLFAIPIGYCTAVLSLTYVRIRDKRIRSYTRWVAVSIASLFAFVAPLASGAGALYGLVAAPALVCAVSMYGSAESLATRVRVLPS